MRFTGTVLVLLTGCVLVAGCGTETLVSPDRPAFDGGGYIGAGGRTDTGTSPSSHGDTATVAAFGGGYIGTGG